MEAVAEDERGILNLPAEVLEHVFADSALSVFDLQNLCQTCSLFKDVIKSNSLWRIKFQQRWPEIHLETERRLLACRYFTQPCWKSVTRQRFLVQQTVGRRLQDMASETNIRLIKYQEAMAESDFHNFCRLLPSEVDKKLQVLFILDELHKILDSSLEWQNLTLKFYAEKSVWFFHRQQLTPVIEEFVATSLEEQDIEVGITLIAQWFQPRAVFSVEDIKHEFNSLADLTKEALKSVSPNHPALSYKSVVTKEKKSLWSSDECRQILHAIEMVVKPTFNRSLDTYYTPRNSFINIVLSRREGIPITLCLIVMCVAKRLGLVLEPVSFPGHFILRWEEFPSKFGLERYSFIDVFGGRYSLSFENLVESFSARNTLIVEAYCDRCTHQEILHRMLRNLLNLEGHLHTDLGQDLTYYSVELSNLFIPHDAELIVLLAEVSLQRGINVFDTLGRIQETIAAMEYDDAHRAVLFDLEVQCDALIRHLHCKMEEQTVSRPDQKKRDKAQVMFAVGMVMKHKKYNYLCVIRGWDETCQASEQWIKQMNVDKCERGRYQPFYNVWVNDGSDRYAAEENLIFTEDVVMVKHPEVGRLFESFNGRYYTPGPLLASIYPDDLRVTHDLVTKFFQQLL